MVVSVVRNSLNFILSEEHTLLLSKGYRRPIRVAIFQQVVIAILCLLMLDGGQLARLCGITMFGFWSGAALIMIRRPWNPTPTDKDLIKLSSVPLFAVAVVIAQILQR